MNKAKLTDQEKEEAHRRMKLENYLKKLAKGDGNSVGMAN